MNERDVPFAIAWALIWLYGVWLALSNAAVEDTFNGKRPRK
jgi:hypothetical protein